MFTIPASGLCREERQRSRGGQSHHWVSVPRRRGRCLDGRQEVMAVWTCPQAELPLIPSEATSAASWSSRDSRPVTRRGRSCRLRLKASAALSTPQPVVSRRASCPAQGSRHLSTQACQPEAGGFRRPRGKFQGAAKLLLQLVLQPAARVWAPASETGTSRSSAARPVLRGGW